MVEHELFCIILTVRPQGRKASDQEGSGSTVRNLSLVAGDGERRDDHVHLNSDASTSMYFTASSEEVAMEWVEAFKSGTLAPAMPMGAHVDMLQRRKTVNALDVVGDGIVWEGWLYKKQVASGKAFRATMLSPWKKRWFELSQDKFTYRKSKDENAYANKHDGKDRSVPLSCCTVETVGLLLAILSLAQIPNIRACLRCPRCRARKRTERWKSRPGISTSSPSSQWEPPRR
jgi:hypothetical protein